MRCGGVAAAAAAVDAAAATAAATAKEAETAGAGTMAGDVGVFPVETVKPNFSKCFTLETISGGISSQDGGGRGG